MDETISMDLPSDPKQNSVINTPTHHWSETLQLDNSTFSQSDITMKSIPNVPGAFTLNNVLTKQECDNVIDLMNKDEGSGGSFEPVMWRKWDADPEAAAKKLGVRIIRKSRMFSESLWERIKDIIPKNFETVNQKEKKFWKAVGLSERVRLIRYDAGQSFPPHMDGPEFISESEQTHLSALFYLDKSGSFFSISKDFRGGELAFLKREGEKLSKITSISPDVGLVVLFPHKTLHEAEVLSSGHKFLIRDDVMYRLERKEAITNPSEVEVEHQELIEQDQH